MSQTELARHIGVKSCTVSLWESGKISPSAVSLVRLADFFKVDPGFFYSSQFVRNNNDPPAP